MIGWWLNPTPLKNMNVNWDDYNQYMGKLKMFQSPSMRLGLITMVNHLHDIMTCNDKSYNMYAI